jgi:hypothetical protein
MRLLRSSASSDLCSFIVFDAGEQIQEGGSPTIFFLQSPPDANSHFGAIIAGVFRAFQTFSAHFNPTIPCDYILTSTHEYALLELSSQIWMAACRRVGTPPNRNLLISILRSCQSIYSLFFRLPQREPDGTFSRDTRDQLSSGFSMIINSIRWADLAFIQAFDSFFQLRLTDPMTRQFELIERLMNNSTVKFSHVAILHSRYFLFYTFPTAVARILSICLSIKFPYLFPSVLAKQDDRMYWIIGLVRSPTGNVAVYAPPICIDGSFYPLIGLRCKKLRILLTLHPDVIPTPALLQKVPPLLKELRDHLRRVGVKANVGAGEKPHLVLKHDRPAKQLLLSYANVSANLAVTESCIFSAQLYATNVGRIADVAFPGGLGFAVYCRERINSETVVLCKTEVPVVSMQIRMCKELESEEEPIIVSP